MEILFADSKDNLYEGPGLGLAGRLGDSFVEPLPEEMIPLPAGATLTMIPERYPVAIDLETGDFCGVPVSPYVGKNLPVYAVGALLPQGFTRTLLPAFSGGKGKKPLPLLGYTLCGVKDGDIYVAARKTDTGEKWSPGNYNTGDLPHLIKLTQERLKQNRLVEQLALCALEYGCFTAQNIFYQRWEAGIPVSPSCNAGCIGCISQQPAECCPAPQRRLDFVPRLEEVVELGLSHLSHADEAIISFGQGCEGEPALQAALISGAIKRIRAATGKGTINMNTNAGHTAGIAQICTAGINSLRVSLNSARPESYAPYYQPLNYTFAQVVESLRIANRQGVFVSLNLLAFPGVNDREEELAALLNLVRQTGINMIQLRNLNIDPDLYLNTLPPAQSAPVGVPELLRILKAELPGVIVGNFSRPKAGEQN